ncbi:MULTISPECIES: NAD(P)H-quinone oxidoreductase [Pseudoalteromonas]|uniref:Quinone oxidoreductase n=1 Tax=Pseudoalteromonas amylolytica TaxID=1859457 RepID=A0A1S1MWW0_9GAMM|nr:MULTISPECIES: NAD(P)H-quinone oxidoreductase [Pseudoalteromonas]OHU88258.1 quinone oxidoreductase [Pseudoalteromonas sp. JW3]OHU91701.1 quinone oxidoreductase [Pseudoalteromonas amylolytica]
MNYITYDKSGQLSIAQTDIPTPQKHEVLIKVAAFGINRADLLQKQGKYPAPDGDSAILGLEAAGTVVGCGDPQFQGVLNKRVFALTAGGAYAEYVCIDALQLFEIPDEVSFETAASLAEVYLTAFDAAIRLGGLQKAQTLLIHGGASGVGSAAIRIAKAVGAKVVTTQSTEQKCQYARQLGADLAINYTQDDFVQVMKAQGLTANVIIDPVAGDYTSKNVKVAAMDCHCINLAMLGGRHVELDMAQILAKRFNLHGSTLRNRNQEYKRELVNAFKKQFASSIFSKNMAIPIYKTVALSEIELAHAILHKNENLGKVVAKVSL